MFLVVVRRVPVSVSLREQDEVVLNDPLIIRESESPSTSEGWNGETETEQRSSKIWCLERRFDWVYHLEKGIAETEVDQSDGPSDGRTSSRPSPEASPGASAGASSRLSTRLGQTLIVGDIGIDSNDYSLSEVTRLKKFLRQEKIIPLFSVPKEKYSEFLIYPLFHYRTPPIGTGFDYLDYPGYVALNQAFASGIWEAVKEEMNRQDAAETQTETETQDAQQLETHTHTDTHTHTHTHKDTHTQTERRVSRERGDLEKIEIASVLLVNYHLLLVPKLLREIENCYKRERMMRNEVGGSIPRSVQLTIVHYLPSVFPSSEMYRILPERQELLTGVLHSNSIVFNAEQHQGHFLTAVTRVIGSEVSNNVIEAAMETGGTSVHTAVIPIGINGDRYKNLSVKILERINFHQEKFVGKKILLALDNLDYTRGIMQKLSAYRLLLTNNPSLAETTVFVQLCSSGSTSLSGRIDMESALMYSGRTSVVDQNELLSQVLLLTGHINATFGSFDSVPVHTIVGDFDEEELIAIMTLADVAIFTALRESVSTRAYQYIYCQGSRPDMNSLPKAMKKSVFDQFGFQQTLAPNRMGGPNGIGGDANPVGGDGSNPNSGGNSPSKSFSRRTSQTSAPKPKNEDSRVKSFNGSFNGQEAEPRQRRRSSTVMDPPKNRGVLILSEFSSSAFLFSGAAMIVNPWDLANFSETLKESLEMNEDERQARHELAQLVVEKNDLAHWSRRIATEFRERARDEPEQLKVPPPLSISKACGELAKRKHLFIVLGLKGTLAPDDRIIAHQNFLPSPSLMETETATNYGDGDGKKVSNDLNMDMETLPSRLSSSSHVLQQETLRILLGPSCIQLTDQTPIPSPSDLQQETGLAQLDHVTVIVASSSSVDAFKRELPDYKKFFCFAENGHYVSFPDETEFYLFPSEEMSPTSSHSGSEDEDEMLAADEKGYESSASHFSDMPILSGSAINLGSRTESFGNGANFLERVSTNLDEICLLIDYFVKRTPGSYRRRTLTSVSWQYGTSDTRFAKYQAKNLLFHLYECPVVKEEFMELCVGKSSVEVRCIKATKAAAVKYAIQKTLRRNQEVLTETKIETKKSSAEMEQVGVLCVGNFLARDEDMYSVVKSLTSHSINCTVGLRYSSADFCIESHEVLRRLLSALLLARSKSELECDDDANHEHKDDEEIEDSRGVLREEDWRKRETEEQRLGKLMLRVTSPLEREDMSSTMRSSRSTSTRLVGPSSLVGPSLDIALSLLDQRRSSSRDTSKNRGAEFKPSPSKNWSWIKQIEHDRHLMQDGKAVKKRSHSRSLSPAQRDNEELASLASMALNTADGLLFTHRPVFRKNAPVRKTSSESFGDKRD